MANLNGAASDLRKTFLGVYSTLKSELLNDPAFEWTDGSRQWVERVRFFPSPFFSFSSAFVALLFFFVCFDGELHLNAVSYIGIFTVCLQIRTHALLDIRASLTMVN